MTAVVHGFYAGSDSRSVAKVGCLLTARAGDRSAVSTATFYHTFRETEVWPVLFDFRSVGGRLFGGCQSHETRLDVFGGFYGAVASPNEGFRICVGFRHICVAFSSCPVRSLASAAL